jgi:competence protein ComEC
MRSAIMATVFCGGYLLRRKPDFLNSIALAAILVLILNPDDLLTSGFQLSFVAVLGISVLARPIRQIIFGAPDPIERLQAPEERSLLKRAMSPARRYVQEGICVSLAAYLSVLGLCIYYFHAFTPLTLFVNIITTPLLWGVLWFCLPAVLLGALMGWTGEPFAAITGALARAMDFTTGVCARVPGSVIYLPDNSIAWVLIYYVLFALVIAFVWRGLRIRYAALAGCLMALLYAASAFLPYSRGFETTVLNVGDGNAVVVRLNDGATLLYDCGARFDPTVGRRVIAPFLWERRVRHIDALVISHADSDHWSGLTDLAKRFSIRQAIVPVGVARLPGGLRLLRTLAVNGIPARIVGQGDKVQVGQSELEILHPSHDPKVLKRSSANDSSCVVRLTSNEGSVIFTGDIQTKGLTRLATEVTDLKADVLMVPHHGRAIKGIETLLGAVSPRVVLVSGKQMVEAYRQGDWAVYDTGSCGAVSVRLDRKSDETHVSVRTGAAGEERLTGTWETGKQGYVADEIREAGSR